MRDRRWRALVAVAAAGMVLATGCAGIPASGVVHVGRRLSSTGGLGDVDVRVQPPQAQPGMTPTAVVLGFLRAVVNNDGDYEIARSYLTPRAAQTWQTNGITTYDDGSVDITPDRPSGKGRTVRLRVERRGFIDARGEFSPQAGARAKTFG